MLLALLSLSQVRSVTKAVIMAHVGLLALKTARLVSNKYSEDFSEGIKWFLFYGS